jgi:hypothetical protein
MKPWRHRLLVIGLPVLLVLFAANHGEDWYRQKCAREREALGASVSVRAEAGAFAGHKTIGIDETQALPEGSLFLRFATLAQWNFDPKSPSPCPRAIQDLGGRDVTCIGFMYPLEAGSKLKTFCLLRTTQTCCYGPRPQYSQYLLVEMKEPVKFERLTPVIVRGRFYPEAHPEQGFIYRMEGKSVTPIEGDEPEADPAEAARKAGLPLFDIASLAAVENGTAGTVPLALRTLDGKRAIVTGYILNRVEVSPPRILVGREWWDGVSQGKPPTIYTAVMVFPADISQVPPVWKDKSIFSGVLHVETDAARWPEAGIVSLRVARRCSSGAGFSAQAGPLLRPAYEVVMLGALLGLALIGKRNGSLDARLYRHAPPTQEERRP